MKRSQFFADRDTHAAKACKTCFGLGECDDMSEHDIGCSTWTCRSCGGTGYAEAPKFSTDAAYALGEEAFQAGWWASNTCRNSLGANGDNSDLHHAWSNYEPGWQPKTIEVDF